MMESMILIAEGEDGTYQVVDIVASESEADEMARNYLEYGPENDWVAPWRFSLVSRGKNGGWTHVRHFEPVAC